MDTTTHDTWRRWLLGATVALGFVCLGLATETQASERTRIVVIKDTYNLQHGPSVDAYQGESIALAADLVTIDSSGNTAALNRPLEEFIWSSDAFSGDSCDPVTDCENTSFDPTDEGLVFNVPFDADGQIIITVRHKITGAEDRIFLINPDRQNASPALPAEDYSDFNRLPSDGFDLHAALAGYGRWTTLYGQAVFVPYRYSEDWAPYQHGRWIWADGQGWVWQAFTPAEEIMHHFGIFRRHRTLGWVVFFPQPLTWRPHAVTFFHTDTGIGWYPYHADFHDRYYRWGYDDGFEDGFWEGYRVGLATAQPYYWGWTYVTYSNFIYGNIYDVRIVTPTVVFGAFGVAYGVGYYGPIIRYPGYYDPRVYIEWRCGVPIRPVPYTVVHTHFVGGPWGRQQTVWVRPAPAPAPHRRYVEYVDTSLARARRAAPAPRIGSVVRPDGGIVSAPRPSRIVPPVRDARNPSGGYRPAPVRTEQPGRWNNRSGNVGGPIRSPGEPPRRPGNGGGYDRPAPVPRPPSGGGWDRPAPAPRQPSGGGWDRPAPAPRQPSGGGWDRPAPAPRQPSGGGGYDRPAPAPRQPSGGGGYDRPAPAPRQPSGGGWDRPAPAPRQPSGGGGYDRPAPAPRQPSGGGGGGYNRPAPAPRMPSGGGGGGGGNGGGRPGNGHGRR